jgi:hypothetical protein
MHAFFENTTLPLNAAIMTYNARIASAIDDLEAQSRPNIAATAKKWQVDRTTLSRRFRGETGSNEEANSNSRQNLTATQEETLVKYINKLSDRGLPPTPQMVKNLAEELAKLKVGKNWTARFCERHAHRLSSLYLRAIDHKRKIADNSYHFEHYFSTVSAFFSFVRLILTSYLMLKA